MSHEKESSSPKSPTQNSLELILGDEIEQMFCENFYPKSVDHLGYDVRLGSQVRLLISGKTEEVDETKGVTILPGETFLARTEEILHIPNWAYAVGSPKMRLIAKGLWTHGGKTDPGYNQRLILGFMNVSNSAITLKRRQPIFHLTFYRINGKTATSYAGDGIGFPENFEDSPLGNCSKLSKETLEGVKKTDGIRSYRICNYLYKSEIAVRRRNKVILTGFSIGTAITIVLALLWYTGNLATTDGFIGVVVTQVITAAVTFSVTLVLERVLNIMKKKE
jgi:deoxycytidine triphosphate deaminase